MPGDAKRLQPVIVRRVKRAGHAPHGGAWKIAYADFVTAMMAFFLLMWLLGSTTEGDKKGLQDYFQSPLRVALSGGTGSGDATSVVRGGGTDLTRSSGQVRQGDVEDTVHAQRLANLRASQAAAERARLGALRERVDTVLAASATLAPYLGQIRLDMTRDGLRIQIVDAQQRPMFDRGSDRVQPYMRELLHEIARMLAEVPNRLTLEGHTDARPYAGGSAAYGNWELSSDRANASRRELVAAGLDAGRVLRVQGLADSVPFDRADPLNPVNRRISIIVMTRDAEQRFFHAAETATPAELAASSAASAAPAASSAAGASSPAAPLR